jgi:vacuolar iron transporter family protein
VKWLPGPGTDDARFAHLQLRARESVLDVNDGIVTAAGIAEGFASAGASTNTLALAGIATIIAGGLALAGARYTEVFTEWEMNPALIEAEAERIEADPAGEFEELMGLYERKGLDPDLARQVATALTARDPVAAHADVELNLDILDSTSGAATAAAISGLSYAAGAALPLIAILTLPASDRALATFGAVLVALVVTGWFAARLTGLSTLKIVGRNVLLGGATMAVTLLVGVLLDL